MVFVLGQLGYSIEAFFLVQLLTRSQTNLDSTTKGEKFQSAAHNTSSSSRSVITLHSTSSSRCFRRRVNLLCQAGIGTGDIGTGAGSGLDSGKGASPGMF